MESAVGDAPFQAFQSAVRDLPLATEAERLVIQRVGQNLFREALLAYWGGRCPMTGITNPELPMVHGRQLRKWARAEG